MPELCHAFREIPAPAHARPRAHTDTRQSLCLKQNISCMYQWFPVGKMHQKIWTSSLLSLLLEELLFTVNSKLVFHLLALNRSEEMVIASGALGGTTTKQPTNQTNKPKTVPCCNWTCHPGLFQSSDRPTNSFVAVERMQTEPTVMNMLRTLLT